MPLSGRLYRVVVVLGLFAMVAVIVAAPELTDDPTTEEVITFGAPGAFMFSILLFWTIKLGRKPNRPDPPPGPLSATLLRSPYDLEHALAVRGGDPDVLDEMGSGQRTWMVVPWLMCSLPAAATAIHFAFDEAPEWAPSAMTAMVGVVCFVGLAIGAWVLLRRGGGLPDEHAWARAFGLHPAAPVAPPRLAFAGVRNGRPIHIEHDDSDCVVRTSIAVPPLRLVPDQRGNLRVDGGGPPGVAEALETLAPYNLWSGVVAQGDAAGLAVTRRAYGAGRVAMDLWLLEWLLEVLGVSAPQSMSR